MTTPKWTFNGESVLDSKGNNVCTKANGPLIASAPDLYAALYAMVQEQAHTDSPVIQAAHAALAKARGMKGGE